MKLLHTIHSANPAGGGVIEAVAQFARAQQAMGDEVEVITLDPAEAEWLKTADFSIRGLGEKADGYGYTGRLLPWLRENHARYDGVIVNGLWQYHGHAVCEALRETGTPYFVFPHGMLDPWFRRAYPWKHVKKQCYWWWREQRVIREAATVFFTTEEERRLARGTFFPYRAREAVANLGIAAPVGEEWRQKEALYAQFPELRGRRLLLFLGRLHAKKGCDLLMRAFAKVCDGRARHGGERFHLVMAGPCEDAAYLEGLKSLAASLFKEPAGEITWAGMLQGDAKWGAFRVAEALALPSHQENFGFSVVEALACGTPVLISNKVNIWREILEDGAGMVGEDDMAAGTIGLIERWVAQTEGEREGMKRRASACFRKRFEASSAAANLRAEIESVRQARISLRAGTAGIEAERA